MTNISASHGKGLARCRAGLEDRLPVQRALMPGAPQIASHEVLSMQFLERRRCHNQCINVHSFAIL